MISWLSFEIFMVVLIGKNQQQKEAKKNTAYRMLTGIFKNLGRFL